jgi:hypothetical protein
MTERPHHREPPTLPRPSTWRLVVAAVVAGAFLYWMYRTGEREGEMPPPPPPPAGQGSLGVTPAATA